MKLWVADRNIRVLGGSKSYSQKCDTLDQNGLKREASDEEEESSVGVQKVEILCDIMDNTAIKIEEIGKWIDKAHMFYMLFS